MSTQRFSLPTIAEMAVVQAAANDILKTYAKEANVEITLRGRRVFLSAYGRTRQWTVRRGQSFYPTYRTGMGGTETTSVANLIRWIQGRPVLPLSTWTYWASSTVQLCNQNTIDLLAQHGYPSHADCLLCGRLITGGIDWWCLDEVSGPCCAMRSGCKQKGRK